LATQSVGFNALADMYSAKQSRSPGRTPADALSQSPRRHSGEGSLSSYSVFK
jgi:hypothetical protein